MATPVTLPQLGESVTEGTVVRWLKQPGESVAVDEPLLEVSTDKVDTEIPSPAAGVLLEIKVPEDETVEVGAELATIGEPGEAGAPAPASDAGPPAATEPEAAPEPAPAPTPASGPPTQSPPTPAAAASGGSAGQEVTLPQLGESVTEGTVVRWLKQVGDSVEADEPLLEVSTDKVDTEIPSPAAGVLLEIKVPEDETVEVGAALAVIGAAGAAPAAPQPAPTPAPSAAEVPAPAPAAAAPAAAAAAAPGPPAPAAPTPVPAPPTAAGGPSPYVTPLVRKLAGQHGVDLSSLTGTGVGGRIRKQDVLAAAEEAKRTAAAPAPSAAPAAASVAAPAAAPAPAQPSPLRGETKKMSRLRQLIADRMVESLQVSAQLTTVVEVDMTPVARLRARAKADFEAREGVKLSFLPFLAKAALEALKVYPMLNASIDVEKKQVTYYDAEHLGVAVDTERGLLVPVIKDAGDLNIAGISRKIADLAERTRTNKITPDELSGGTFTLTNTGSRGALFDTPIINQPQTGILGTGAIVKRPVVVQDALGTDAIAVRQMMYLALTYDHRLVDGADAARFLTAVKQRLEEGAFEGDLGL
jgi:2-oxoglutarate dehydrogenase E2 component (dihydrolipoamide succinyltransferase)